jgi:hypothetical protein
MTSEYLALIAPSVHPRYSPYLHAFLQKRLPKAPATDCFMDPEGRLYLGEIFDGDFIGARLQYVLCHGTKSEVWSYGLSELKVTPHPTFWADYQQRGRCAIDTEHQIDFHNTHDRYRRISPDSRTCQWCGHVQILHTWKEEVERRRWI